MRTPAALLFAMVLLGCAAPQSTPVVQPTGASANPTPVVQPTGAPANPTPNAAFVGSLEAVPGVAGDISFVISDAGQIAEMKLEGGLKNFDCGAGKTIIDSGTTTYFFPDPIVIAGGRFSISRGDSLPLDWDGVFTSAREVHGNIRLSGGTDCQNRPPSVTWSATSEGS